MSTLPLWRNRDFVLLQAGQLLSTLGTQTTYVAYPLLTLAVTQSPAKAGLVGFARLLPHALLGLLAGVAADRWDRRRLMLGADSIRVLAVGGLAAGILLDQVTLWMIVLAAGVEGTGSSLFHAAQPGAVRAVVPRRQLPAAMGAQAARTSTVLVAGPPLGGALFGLGRAVPFVVDAASYAASFVSLALMRTPFQDERDVDPARLRTQIADGVRFLWSHPFIRTTALLFAIGNVTIPAMLLVIVVAGKGQGLSAAAVGALFAAFGAATLVGALASPLFRRALSMRTIVMLELWAALVAAAFLIWPNVYVLTAAMMVQGVCLPVTDSVVDGYRIAVTPDRLVGRVESARTTIALLLAPLGPLASGLLLSSVSARASVAVILAFSLLLALWGTLSPSIRAAPRLSELDLLDAVRKDL